VAFQARLLDAAARDLARLDKPEARRIVRRINWLTSNLDTIRPETLSGDQSALGRFAAASALRPQASGWLKHKLKPKQMAHSHRPTAVGFRPPCPFPLSPSVPRPTSVAKPRGSLK
jgi:hypothetical protein